MKNNLFYLGIIILVLSFACSSPKNEKQAPEEDELYTLPGLGHGLVQSPINILTYTLEDADEHEIEVMAVHEDQVAAIVNKGHTIELEFEPGKEVVFDGKVFEFEQAHFHTPSEHQVDGMTFPMEMHFVCVQKTFNKDKPEYFVIAAFFKMGKKNKFIHGFIDKIPKHENDTISVEDDHIYIGDLIGDINPERKYYYYKGSLTTPPYTETVNWLVLRDIIDASPEQIKTINDLEGNNARHVQANFGRAIEAN